MRKILILMNFAVLVILISSCEGLLNPEPDTHTTQIKYHKVLKDQEHSVIMPLKEGNMWTYKVTDIKNNKSHNATIIVKKDTLINGTSWFFVNFPIYNNEYVCITNTDVGLSHNCLICPSLELLQAEYPVNYTTYLYKQEDYPTQFRDYSDDGVLIDQYILTVNNKYWVDVEIIKDFPTIYGKLEAYKYSMRGESNWTSKSNEKKQSESKLVFIEYFVPDLGLVRKELCEKNADGTLNIYELWELTSTNVKI